MVRYLTILATLLALLAAGCSSQPPSSTPTAYRLDGVWGGVMNHAGADFGIFAMDVVTTVSGSSGTVEGAVIRGSWSYPSAAVGGSMRMTREENVDLLSAARGEGAATLADLF